MTEQAKRQGPFLGVAALILYIVGGISAFSGIALIVFWKGKDLCGWGEGRPIGYLLLCVGVGLSLLSIVLMRIFRNRGFA